MALCAGVAALSGCGSADVAQVGTRSAAAPHVPACFPGCSGANLSGTDMHGLDISEGDFEGANMSRVNLVDAFVDDAHFENVNLVSAHLNGARIKRTALIGANLTAATVEDANLSGSDLSGATLLKTNLNGANLTGVNFRGAHDLDAAAFNAATLWSQTTCPDGTVVTGRSCWQ